MKEANRLIERFDAQFKAGLANVKFSLSGRVGHDVLIRELNRFEDATPSGVLVDILDRGCPKVRFDASFA